MDAAGAYHRQMTQGMQQVSGASIINPLMKIQDPRYTQVILVTLPETTPVSQAAELHQGLRHAGVEPYAWVLNRSFAAAGSVDPVLRARMVEERRQMTRIQGGLAQRLNVIPFMTQRLAGAEALSQIAQ